MISLRMLRARRLGYGFEAANYCGEIGWNIYDERTGDHIGSLHSRGAPSCFIHDQYKGRHSKLEDALTNRYDWRAAFGMEIPD